MIHTELNLKPILPFTRATAARLAATASKYESRLTLECEGLVLNMKSMLGLLSQARLPEGKATLVADGPDEVTATQAVLNAISLPQA
ncbi:MAG TPA: HPr family phosphocarrier protein [Candidatus Limiplasma sp.]|nr:HPr family phosphocarrier protein [Candidatus Limiplasma sp.]HPS80609.1 HPr family phosphocarrier protein [Candidatus Limiplasma sp.]